MLCMYIPNCFHKMFNQMTTFGHCFLQQRKKNGKKNEHWIAISHFHNKMCNSQRITHTSGHLVELYELSFLICKLNRINHLLSHWIIIQRKVNMRIRNIAKVRILKKISRFILTAVGHDDPTTLKWLENKLEFLRF